MRHYKLLVCGAIAAVCMGTGLPVLAAEATAGPDTHFQEKVLPLLQDHCFQCHSHKAEKIKGELVLDSRAGLLQGGASGPAIVPGHPEDSLLILAVSQADPDLQMPPAQGDTKPLNPSQVQSLIQWVKDGAPWPGSSASDRTASDAGPFTRDDQAWWAFQPVVKPAPPILENDAWSRNEIDAFILRKLRQEDLAPAPEASPQTLIRRLYFDLWGLPPSPEEIDAFVQDPSPDAYRQLVDRLLDSPRYGERWARHWLDLVRFAESDGYKSDDFRPQAWRYRDYVIQSLNQDKPYDQFVMEQLAGDELAPQDPEVMVATGFLRNGIYEYNQRNVRGQWNDMLYDITDVTGEVFMGMGMACARCHNHKFDPILQKDYYRLLSFFAPLNLRDDIPLATPRQWTAYQRELTRWEEATADIRRAIDAIVQPHLDSAARGAITKLPEDIQEIFNKPKVQRTPLETQLYELAYRQVTYEHERIDTRIKGGEKERLAELQKQLAAFDHLKPEPLPQALLATDIGPVPPATVIPKSRTRQDVAPGFLSILDPKPARITPPPYAPNSTGRRSALARWLTRPDHPLTSRVMVNRLWQHHFSRGLAATTSDLGRLGEPPSHPELLDWLAAEFVERGWSLKAMHRLMVNSAAYRQSARIAPPEVARMKDPENRLLWRMNLQRLDGEEIRDALLAVTGELELDPGGPSAEFTSPRRTIYTKAKRNSRPELLDVFDPPDTYASSPQRNVTTTPTQSLLMINGAFTVQRAQTLSRQLHDLHPEADPEFITEAYQRVLGRAPTSTELAGAIRFISPPRDDQEAQPSAQTRRAAREDFCHALLNANEFLYVD